MSSDRPRTRRAAGSNGAGKSTLTKAIGGTLAPFRRAGRAAVARWLLRPASGRAVAREHSPLWHLRQRPPVTREQELRDFRGFDFRGDMASAAIAAFPAAKRHDLRSRSLSGDWPNLLLLDEPTNDLDIDMREALTEALQEGDDGALVVVAHDRDLLRATIDELWIVVDGVVALFDGDLDDYRDFARACAVASARAAPLLFRSPEPCPATAKRRSVRKPRAARKWPMRRSRCKPGSKSRTRNRGATMKARLDAWSAARSL